MRARWLIVILLAAACASPRSAGGPVKPSSPGPLDLVRGLWGDYGGRCPGDYKYCKGSPPVCCPIESRCEEDAGGPYCGPRDTTAGVGASAAEPVAPRCRSDEITCSYRGETTCCPGDQRCCTIDGAPGCCP